MKRLPPDEELLTLAKTMKQVEIAKRYGVTNNTVWRAIKAAKQRRDDPKPKRVLPWRKLPLPDELLRLSKTMTNQEISHRYDVALSHVNTMVRKAHIDAGLEPPELNRKLPPDDELLRLAETMSYKEIGEQYNCHPKSVGVRIRYARLALGYPPRRYRRISLLPPDDELLAECRVMTQTEMAKKYGVSTGYLCQRLKAIRQAAGLPPARRGALPKSKAVPRFYQGPPKPELLDALERWGIDGVAEEYDVDQAQVCAWMRELGI